MAAMNGASATSVTTQCSDRMIRSFHFVMFPAAIGHAVIAAEWNEQLSCNPIFKT